MLASGKIFSKSPAGAVNRMRQPITKLPCDKPAEFSDHLGQQI